MCTSSGNSCHHCGTTYTNSQFNRNVLRDAAQRSVSIILRGMVGERFRCFVVVVFGGFALIANHNAASFTLSLPFKVFLSECLGRIRPKTMNFQD